MLGVKGRSLGIILGACVAALGVVSSASAGGAASAASCSNALPGAVGVNAWSEAHAQLAPKHALSVRLCHYAGLNSPGQKPGHLAQQALVPSSKIAELAAAFDALPRTNPSSVMGCPMDDGEEIIAHLAYAGGRAVTIAVGLSGCRSVSNGDRASMLSLKGGAHLLTLLDALL